MFVLHFNQSSTVRLTSLTISWLIPVGKFIETTHAPAGGPWDEIRLRELSFFIIPLWPNAQSRIVCCLIRNAEKRLIRYYEAAHFKFPYFKNGTFSADKYNLLTPLATPSGAEGR